MIQQSPAKTKRFLKAINRAAMQKCNDIAAQIEQTTKEAMQRAEEEASRDGHRRIAAAKAKIEAKAKMEVAEYEKAKKSEIYQKRLSYRTEVFSAAEEKLKLFTKSDAYLQYLEETFAKISDKVSNNLTIFLANEDTIAASYFQKKLQEAEIKTDDSIEIGGFKIKDNDKSLILDCTLDAGLAAELDWFLLHSNLQIDF